MRIRPEIFALLLSAVLAVQGWSLLEVINLKTDVAKLGAKVEDMKRP